MSPIQNTRCSTYDDDECTNCRNIGDCATCGRIDGKLFEVDVTPHEAQTEIAVPEPSLATDEEHAVEEMDPNEVVPSSPEADVVVEGDGDEVPGGVDEGT